MRTLIVLLVTLLLTSTSSKAADVLLAGETDPSWSDSLMAGVLDAAQAGRMTVTINIDSPGGYVSDGVNVVGLMEMFKTLGMTFHCKVTGKAMSAAFFVFSACDERTAVRNAQLLWHPMWSEFRIIELYPMSKELESQLAEAVDLQNAMNRYIADKTRVPWSRWEPEYLDETNFSAIEMAEFAPGFMSVGVE